MAPLARQGALLAFAVVFLGLVDLTAGSHFRYGTLSWAPLDSLQMAVQGLKQEVEFTLRAAYRRDYEWGRIYGERWAQTSDVRPEKVFYGNEAKYADWDTNNPGCDINSLDEAAKAACFNCPTNVDGIANNGISATAQGCVNYFPHFDRGNLDTNLNNIPGEKFFIRFPPKRQNDEVTEIVQCPTPFYCDIVIDGVDNSAQADLCSQYRDNPERDVERCARWEDVYGMFVGDEDGTSVEIELEVESMDHTDNPVIGNYLVGVSRFFHFYYQNTPAPYTAYFTGGDRIYECVEADLDEVGNCKQSLDYMLNNNAEGRFRIETTIWIKGDGNRSPIATMIPILPVPRRPQGLGRSKFQVAAYDPDVDNIQFRFGTETEMGGIMRSKSVAFPESENTPPGPYYSYLAQQTGANSYGPFGCTATNKFYVKDGTCPTDRTPSRVPGVEDFSFTSVVPGLIEWDPWVSMAPPQYCVEENGACSVGLRQGLYNFVVIVEDTPNPERYGDYYTTDLIDPADAWMSKVTVDFMAYLYDGPMYFCNSDCQKNEAGVKTYASRDGLYDGCAVCGLGSAAASNSSVCTASTTIGACGEYAFDGVTIVPPADACKLNHAPVFISPNGQYEELLDTPEVEKWAVVNEKLTQLNNAQNEVSEFEYPQITQYFGTVVEFYVTAIDYDECTDLVLECTGLPEARAPGTDDWKYGKFGDYLYPTAPDGESMMVRRKFTWEAPPGSAIDENADVRDATTLVCFYAYDIYFASADPFYCVQINLKFKPSAEEETIMRFDCKMALLWSPIVRRFVFADPLKKYYSTCRYEDFMWHHAMVSIDENGIGQLFIDGEPSALMEPLDPSDLSKGFDPAPLGDKFETQIYPNKCTSRRRELLEFEEHTARRALLEHGGADDDDDGILDRDTDHQITQYFGTQYQINDNSDQPVIDSFTPVTVSQSGCCSFNMGSKCDPLDLHEFKTFAGFLDEAAIWNRPLEQYEIKSTMFHMPQKTSARQLEAARGVEVDYTAGRVLYARFNNPCMESPEQSPPPPSPPPPFNEGLDVNLGLTGRRLQQITRTTGTRREFISDKAGFTAGVRGPFTWNPTDNPSEGILTDLDDDHLTFRNFPQNALYAYNGVPWAPPYIMSLSSGDDPIPLDGGVKITIDGVGFSRSPFLKCMSVQPDPADVFVTPTGKYVNPDSMDVQYPYNNFYYNIPGRASTNERQLYDYDETTQYTKSPASVVFGKGAIPYVNQFDFHYPTNEDLWDPEADDTREGNIPPFIENVLDSHLYDYVYGSWEKVVCDMPPAAFPSQDYYFGVSNDGGYSSSPPTPEGNVVMDYSILFDGTGSFFLPDELRDAMGGTFTVSAWVYPTEISTSDDDRQVIVEFGTGTGVLFDTGGVIISALNNAKQTPSANETAINEWHHIMVVFDGTTASFYLDGIDEFSYGGGSSSRSFAGFGDGPSQVIFGSGFRGGLDEVKIWAKTIAFDQLFYPDQIMFTREMSNAPTGVIAYYRFNNLTALIDPETNLIKDELMTYHGTGSGGFSFTPMAVPWEPSTIYSVDDTSAHDEHHIITTPQTGSQTLTVTGFNLASSQWTGCRWGQATVESKTIKMTVDAEPDYPVCEVPELILDGSVFDFAAAYSQVTYDYYEEMLGRVDMKVALMESYPAQTIDMEAGVFSPGTSLDATGTSFTCDTPSVEDPAFAILGPGNMNTFNLFGMEFTEVALECNGDNYVSADQVSLQLTPDGGYTFGLWTLPAPNGKGVDAIDNWGVKRKLLSEQDKNLRRKLGGHEGPEMHTSTLLAFESVSGDVTNNGLIMYDGERFFYYDDCILDVTQTGPVSTPDEWHFVMVSITAEGEGTLMVDGKSFETFTTTCKPSTNETDALFSICQDYSGKEAASTYVGIVDEVMVFDAALTSDEMMEYMFKPYGTTYTPAAYYDFADPAAMLPFDASTAGVFEGAGDGMFIKSTGPWFPATVVEAVPHEVDASGGTTVSVYGTNFAPSQWLEVGFGEATVKSTGDIDSGILAINPPVRVGDHACGSGSIGVSVINNEAVPSFSIDEEAASLSFNTTVTDLYKDMIARYKFTLEGATVLDSEEFHIYDYSGNGNDIPYPAGELSTDKDLNMYSSVYFGNESMIDLSGLAPEGDYTFCAEVFMDITDPPTGNYPGAWKLVCLVHFEGSILVYLNNDLADELSSAWYTEHFGSNILGDTESGYVDNVWLYGRALKACEVEARYYTSLFSIDFTKISMKNQAQIPTELPAPPAAGPTELTAPVYLSMPDVGSAKFTFMSWIYPYETEGIQTILSSKGDILVEDTTTTESVMSFTLNENALSFAQSFGCTCQPCTSALEYTSWKTKVPSRVWSHVGVALGPMEDLGEGPGWYIAFFVDGMLKDLQKFPGVVLPVPVYPLQLGQSSIYELTSFPFKGIIGESYYVSDVVPPHEVKKVMQCPPKDIYDPEGEFLSVPLLFNEGGGDTAVNGAVTGLAGLWINTTYDDATSPISTTFFGEMSNQTSGYVGEFVITSRTACRKKRISGGDEYHVTMTGPDGSVYEPEIVDTNDGNYHVTYKNLMCATYETSITLDDAELSNFDITIHPGLTDPTKTFIVDGLPTPQCFGAQTNFVIQTVDEFGCLKTDSDDVFNITFTGPYEFAADVTPQGDGKYLVNFVPEAPGDYHMTMLIMSAPGGPTEIKDGMYHCINVCSDGSLSLAGNGGLVIEEDGYWRPGDREGDAWRPGITDIDLSFPGVTMELWMKLPAGFAPSKDMYLLHKGGADQLGAFTKTYEMVVNTNGELSASVYVGLGEIRTVTADLSSVVGDTWYHIAAVYDETTFVLYLDGAQVGSAEFVAPLPVKTNEYLHPLEIGAGFEGHIDEVKLWKVARTLFEIVDTMYCSPYLEMEKVAAYFSFNEGTGVTASGHSDHCPPQGEHAIVHTCLQGALPEDGLFVADTPSLASTEGFNAPSAVYSTEFGPGLSRYTAASTSQQFTIVAKDKCKYAYTKTDETAFTATTWEYSVTFFDTRAPFGTEYPVMKNELTSEPVYAVPPAGKICPGDQPAPGPPKGDIYSGYLATPKSGAYYVEIACNGELMHHPYYLLVSSAVPVDFSTAELGDTIAAGVPTGVEVQLLDAEGNVVLVDNTGLFTAEVTLLSTSDGVATPAPYVLTLTGEDMSFNKGSGTYTLFMTLAQAGSYSLILSGDGMNMYTQSFTVTVAPWRNMLTNDLSVPLPTRRFEHTSAMYGGDLYIFGGAQYDKTYMNDMYVLQNAETEFEDGESLRYKKKITIDYSIATEKNITIEVRVNTAELIAAGRMNPSCLDVKFTLPNNGEPLYFYFDPWPGCNRETTLYWVSLPAGSVSASASLMQIEMYYGNPTRGLSGSLDDNDPSQVFHMYEGFEAGGYYGFGMFQLSSSCDGLAPVNPQAFQVADSLPFYGEYSLHANWGQEGVLVAYAPSAVTDWKLRAWFYDSDATNSSHYISPDFGMCSSTAADETGKFLLPVAEGPLEAVSSAIGPYTLSHLSKYCVASPWESTATDEDAGLFEITRSADWHLFEIKSVAGVVTLTIDEKKVKEITTGGATLDKVLLSAGFGVDSALHPGLKNSHAFWDEISVALVEPGVSAVTATPMAEDEAVAQAEAREWFKVQANGTPPPPRYAHSAVVFDGKMYIFGGERSAYAYNDVWAYDFETSTWEFVVPTNAAPSPRFDHTAAVTSDGHMVIYGGRSGLTPLSDIWVFDIASKTWTELTGSAEAGARFGHSATIPTGGSDMYVFGGYAEYGFSGAFFKCSLASGSCTNITLGCETPDVSSSFLPTGLVHRYEHTSFSDANYVYVYGGASIVDTYGYSGIYRFAVAECSWSEVPVAGLPVARYEHTAGLMAGGMYVHGGHAGGDYYDDTLFFPL